MERAAGDAGVGDFGVPDDAGVVNFLVCEANVGGSGNYFWSGSNWARLSLDLTPFLRRVIFVIEAALDGARRSSRRVSRSGWRTSAASHGFPHSQDPPLLLFAPQPPRRTWRTTRAPWSCHPCG